jgi:hypothetical protein
MPISGGGFEQSYNAQACVDIETLIIIENHLTQQTNDKQEIEPAIQKLKALPEALRKIKRISADTGYFSANNVIYCENNNIMPYIANGRHYHNLPLEHYLAESKDSFEKENRQEIDKGSAVDKMKNRMKTEEGREFYAKRKSTIEPVFGIIKEVMGFRQFLLRGFEAVKGEWNLVCIAFNLKRIHTLI